MILNSVGTGTKGGGLLTKLRLKILLCEILQLGDIFSRYRFLADDSFMSGIHLRKVGSTYSASGPFAKNKK